MLVFVKKIPYVQTLTYDVMFYFILNKHINDNTYQINWLKPFYEFHQTNKR